MSDSKTPSDNPTSALSAAADPSAAAASASPAVTIDPKAAVAAPAVAAVAAPAAADPKAGEAVAIEEVITPDPNAPATGVNAAEAKALADAATAKAVTDKAAADATAEAAAAVAVPESYALDDKALAPEVAKFLKENGGLNPELLPALTPALKEAKLTQKQFAGIVNAFLGFQQNLPAMMLNRDMAAVKADPSIGGLNYSRSMEEVSVALDAFADPDFKKWTVQAGIANKPEFVRVFQRIGRAMRAASDSPSTSSPDAAAPETMAQRMYGRKKT